LCETNRTFPRGEYETSIIALAALIITTTAHADGFRCLTQDHKIKATVYDNVQPAKGTRNGAIMILSQASQDSDKSTLAVFRGDNGSLTNRGPVYTGNVDMRFAEVNQALANDEAPINMADMSQIILNIDYNMNSPVPAGEVVTGLITFNKRSGPPSTESVICTRYLKN